MDRNIYQYYVEGDCEQNFLRSYMHAKTQDVLIRPGRIEVLNPVAERISNVKAIAFLNSGVRPRKGMALGLFDGDLYQSGLKGKPAKPDIRVSVADELIDITTSTDLFNRRGGGAYCGI